jgi:hypothetical protein
MKLFENPSSLSLNARVTPRKKKGPLVPRLLLLLGVATFVAAFNLAYFWWLYPVYGAEGFVYNEPPLVYLIPAIGFSLAPSLWMPIALTRPSQIIYWVLYLTAFIPSMFVPLYTAFQPYYEVAKVMTAMFAGLALIRLGYRLPLLRRRPIPSSPVVFWATLSFCSLLLLAWVLSTFKGRLQFVSFENVYEVRLSTMDITVNQIAGYALMWLSSVVNPFLMAWGLNNRKKALVLIGAAGQVFLYTTTAAKSVILSAGLVPLFYLALLGKNALIGLRIVWGTIALFGLIMSIDLVYGGEPDDIGYWPSALVFARVFGIPGMSTAVYHDFFTDHPLTYWSHVKGISLLIPYPYDRPVPMVVGLFVSGTESLCANAHPWCQDGLAAWGLPGILVASLLCIPIFWMLDSAASGHELIFTGPLISFTAANIGNASMFTTMFSGGLFLIIIILYFLPRRHAVTVRSVGALASPALSPRPSG